jgi:hypothetical protein
MNVRACFTEHWVGHQHPFNSTQFRYNPCERGMGAETEDGKVGR